MFVGKMKKIVIVFVMVFIAYVVVQASRIFLSSANASSVYAQIAYLESKPSVDGFQWQTLAEKLSFSRWLNGDSPDYRDVEQMLLLRSGEVRPGSVLEQYRLLLRQRPSWPYAWLNLLVAKGHAKEFDEEYHHAWARLAVLAPWVKKVNAALLVEGLRDWDELDDATRALVVDVVANGLSMHPSIVDVQLKEYQRRFQLCAELEVNQRAVLSCTDDASFDAVLSTGDEAHE